MALAVMACVGSLLGWQFTLATTAKDAADTKMFPAIFGKANARGAPIAGMVIMGVVQTVLALSTISPDLNKQSGTGQPRVVTNVAVHHCAVGAVRDDAQRQGRPANVAPQHLRHGGRVAVLDLRAVGVGQRRRWAACW
jgi:putrescine:ornithine antiporter